MQRQHSNSEKYSDVSRKESRIMKPGFDQI
jgi:hypothetical protein